MPKLYSYVVDHDHGFAPNPSNGICTLVHCKFGGLFGRSNIVEGAEIGDWILGTGGSSASSAGNGKVIYFMRVDEKPDFQQYLNDVRFQGRIDHIDHGENNLYALVSTHYYYFGRDGFHIDELPSLLRSKPLLKGGQGFRCDYPNDLIDPLVKWFEQQFKTGKLGEPCDPLTESEGSECVSECRLAFDPSCKSDCKSKTSISLSD